MELQADDYDPATRFWRNRAVSGAFPPAVPMNAHGHFYATGAAANARPTKATLDGATAVVFSPADGAPDRLESNFTYYDPNSVWGGSDFSFEAWFYLPAGQQPPLEQGLFLYSARNSANCASGFFGLGEWTCAPWPT